MTTTGISRVSRAEAERAARGPASVGTKLFNLPAGIRDKKSLFAAIRETLPLDPPISTERDNWDALEDSLWSGLYSIAEHNAVIVWPDADEMQRTSLKEFDAAVAILEDVALTLGDPKVTNGPVKMITFVLGGRWT
jgi:hypothetical protein